LSRFLPVLTFHHLVTIRSLPSDVLLSTLPDMDSHYRIMPSPA